MTEEEKARLAAEEAAKAAASNPPATPPAEGQNSFSYKGLGVELKSPEELVEYAKNLETQVAKERVARETEAANRQPEPQLQHPVNQLTDEEREIKEIADLRFTNPEEAERRSIALAERKIDARYQARDNAKALWDDFYSKNPDLAQRRGIVEAVTQRHSHLPATQALKAIAEDARKLIGEAIGQGGEVKHLPARPGGGGLPPGHAAPPAAQPPAKPLSFFEQAKAWRAKAGGAKF